MKQGIQVSETSMHRRRRLLRLTSRCSLPVRLYTSSPPTVSLCESNALNHETTMSKGFQGYTPNALIYQPTMTNIVPKSGQNTRTRVNPSQGTNQRLNQSIREQLTNTYVTKKTAPNQLLNQPIHGQQTNSQAPKQTNPQSKTNGYINQPQSTEPTPKSSINLQPSSPFQS